MYRVCSGTKQALAASCSVVHVANAASIWSSMPPRRQTHATRAGLKPQTGTVALRPVNRLALALFRRFIAKRRLRASFRAVRLAFADRLPQTTPPAKVIFYLNHPSWWDPLLCMVLAQRFVPGRNVYAPIDADQLERYAVLRPLGLFPVQPGTLRGTVQFFRAAEAVLARGDMLAVTPQGAFTDQRLRPAGLKQGLGTLLARLERRGEHVIVIPFAVEYTFWNQRLPEILVAIGQTLATKPAQPPRTADAWTAMLDEHLTAVQDELAALAQMRDENDFETVLQGSRGAAGIYGRWQWLRGLKRDHPTSAPKTGRS
jgi:1-acyl-sn-glycerol-3-phosphate acyltransferase